MRSTTLLCVFLAACAAACAVACAADSGGTTTAAQDSGPEPVADVDPAPEPDVEDTGPEPDPSDRWTDDCPADEIEHRTVNVGAVDLHVACQGSGPTLVLLHGFPEFWYGWHGAMGHLAAAGYRVVVPDQRGYNTSDKPPEQDDYAMVHLVGDVVGLIDAVSDEPVVLVGHDWGGVVAWAVGGFAAASISRLVIANAPHPDVFARELAENPAQQAASFYIDLLLTEGFEDALAADDFATLSQFLPADLSDADLQKYKDAWGQEGALLGMVRWYRANFQGGGPAAVGLQVNDVPVLVLWGMGDTALLAGNLVGLGEYVADLQIKRYDDATHWINHEYAAEIAADIAAFAAGETVGEPPD